MKYLVSLLFVFISFVSPGLTQYKREIDSLLSELEGNSAGILHQNNAKRIISYGTRMLPELALLFTDSTTTSLYSGCTKRNLRKGELAMILADHIEPMPYFHLTGMQNCTLASCENNPNFIEYYLEFIALRNYQSVFMQRYIAWLNSRERKKYKQPQ